MLNRCREFKTFEHEKTFTLMESYEEGDMKTGSIVFLMCIIFTLSGIHPVIGKTHVERLNELYDRAWEYHLKTHPLFATRAGDHRYDAELPDVRLEAYEARLSRYKKFLKELQSIPLNGLPPEERLNAELFHMWLNINIKELEFRSYLMPISSRSGFYVEFAELPENMSFKTITDYENYLARLEKFSGWVDDFIDMLEYAIEKGYRVPKVTLTGVAQALRRQIVDDVKTSRFYRPFRTFPGSIPSAKREKLRMRALKAIRESVIPGYKKFLKFFNEKYYPSARETYAISEVPNGRAFYAWRVKRYTTLQVTPEEVHQIGLKEVARIREEMEDIMKKTGYHGTFRQFLSYLRTNKRFYPKTAEELLRRAAYIVKRMDGELPKLFGKLPRMPYGIKEVPAYIAPYTTTAYYEPPSGDGKKAGFYYVNTSNLDQRPLYELEALSLHEAVPGHHLQIALQLELENVPQFRRFLDATAFVEGWALYAEKLGLEAGFYTDPYSNFGRLTYEMWRACRLVVDTGIHAMGWTRAQAIDFMAKNTALSLHNIETEVDRYISWPGQALAYKMGELAISRLRQYAEKELGEKFDVRAFHDEIHKNGAVPLTVLEANIKKWVEREKKK